MRGVNRGSTMHRVARRVNPQKLILFGVSLIVLCNVCPWSFLENRLNRGWKDISSLEGKSKLVVKVPQLAFRCNVLRKAVQWESEK